MSLVRREVFSLKKTIFPGQKGQTEVEFMLILPFFLAVVFGLLMFVMLVFKGQMLTYATFMAGRAAAVKHPWFGAKSQAEKAARQILPGVNISARYGSGLVTFPFTMMPQSGGPMTVTGSYRLNPLAAAKSKSSLDAGMSSVRTIRARLPMHHFQSPRVTLELRWNTSNGVAEDDNVYTVH